ncbi:capsid assembly scaffolding protein Gp46 family protein [Ligilactobacillus ruminis]|uniref:capsid assembly scaffolding protein Gp46 family protein n=1 Tax=Ligilactobacillus ruminis TaxID=1623 RepID=UPI003B9BD808
MDNDATVTDTVADVKATATEPEQTADEPKKTEPEQKKVDADAVVKKLQKRIGAEQSKKNSYKEQLDNALKEIEKLKSGKSVKTLSDEDKAKKDVDEKDKEIAALKSQIARRQTLDDTDQVLRENGLIVPSNVLNFLVSDDADNTYSNVKAFIDYTETVKDSVREEFKKGRTPRVSGTTAKAVSQKDFDGMTQKERVALFHSDPELFKKFTTIGGR